MGLRLVAVVVLALFCAVAGAAGGVTSGGAASRASEAIVFVSDRDGHKSVYVVNADRSGLRKLVDGARDPSWSPTGRRLAFLHDIEDASPDGSSTRLDVLDADGSNRVHPVGMHTFCCSPLSWSPDESRIAYEAIADEGIYVANVDGSGEQLLVRGDASKPAWSSAGNSIAFIRRDKDRADHLTILNTDGTNERRLRSNVAFSVQPAWSPDGSKILFGRDTRSGGENLYLVNSDGSGELKLAATPIDTLGVDHPAQWSPDGRWVAFAGLTKDFASQTYVVRADGTGLKVVDEKGSGTSWSPDGTALATVRNILDEGGDIWAVAADGTGGRRVTSAVRFGYEDSSPQWHPRSVRAEDIGGIPVSAAIPTDSVVDGNVLRATAAIDQLAADGDRVAIGYDNTPNCTELWQPRTKQVTRFPSDPCGALELALGGQRVAWLTTDEGTHLYFYVESASLAQRRPRVLLSRRIGPLTCLPRPSPDCSFVADLHGGGGVLIFDTWQCAPSRKFPSCNNKRLNGKLWRIAGGKAKVIRSEARGLTALAARGSRVAFLRSDGRIALLEATGRLRGVIAVHAAVRGAALGDRELAVLTPQRLLVYALSTLRLERSLAIAGTGGSRRLAGIGGGTVAYTEGRTIKLVRLAEGTRRSLTVPGKGAVHAALTSSGLFYAYELPADKYRGRIAFVPLRK